MLSYKYKEDMNARMAAGDFSLVKITDSKKSDASTFTFEATSGERIAMLLHDYRIDRVCDLKGKDIEIDPSTLALAGALLKDATCCGVIGERYARPSHVVTDLIMEARFQGKPILLALKGNRG